MDTALLREFMIDVRNSIKINYRHGYINKDKNEPFI